MIKNYRKKPVVIQALEWTGDNQIEMLRFVNTRSAYFDFDDLIIETLEGNHKANIGDYVIRGVANEYYPCRPDIFNATYELV